MYAPGLDIDVVQQLSLKTSTQRLSINFMGCYGAFNALKMANAICTADKHANVLVVCVELCSIHFQNAWTLDAIIANAIFADGAAAALIQASSISKHLQFRSFHCDIVPQSRQEMAWRIADFGFEMVLTSYVPDVIKTGISQFTDALLQKTALSWQDIHYFAIHPGGLKILQACETALAITPADNRWSYEVFRQYGNMSSATILFVLRDLLQACKTEDNEKKIFSCAFGPGLTLESMILQMSI
jgi:predicted naringenin-chalcone synthase